EHETSGAVDAGQERRTAVSQWPCRLSVPGVGRDDTCCVHPPDAAIRVVGDVDIPVWVDDHVARIMQLCARRGAVVPAEAGLTRAGDSRDSVCNQIHSPDPVAGLSRNEKESPRTVQGKTVGCIDLRFGCRALIAVVAGDAGSGYGRDDLCGRIDAPDW